MKLSKAQIRVLGLMPIEKVEWVRPDGIRFYKDGKILPGKIITWATYISLRGKGLIEVNRISKRYDYPARYEVKLTPAGRAALSEGECGKV